MAFRPEVDAELFPLSNLSLVMALMPDKATGPTGILLGPSRTLWGLSRTGPTPVSSACLFLSVEKLQSKNTFNQRREKMQKEKQTVKRDKIITV